MIFKIHESNGNWTVTKDSENIKFIGGEVIDNATYKELQDKPHEASNTFELNEEGDIVAKPMNKDVK